MDFNFDNNELFEELDFDQLREVWEIIDQKINMIVKEFLIV